MTEDLHSQTRELLRDVERKDQKFRILQVVFNLLIIGLLVLALVYGYQSYQSNQAHRTEQINQVIQEVDKNRDFIKCVVQTFNDTTPAQYKSDINKCISDTP